MHLSDPENYDKIYSVGSKFTKDPSYYALINEAVSTPIILSILPNEAHKARRAPLNPFFSRRAVLSLEEIVWSKVDKLCNMVQSDLGYLSADTPPADGAELSFDAYSAFRALSVDIISEYAYARCWNYLDKRGLGMGYHQAIRAVQDTFIWFQTFPFLLSVFNLIPLSLKGMLSNTMREWHDSLTVGTCAPQNFFSFPIPS